MKCKGCGKEFCPAERGPETTRFDRGDGVVYGGGPAYYAYKPICPRCGHNNSRKFI